MKKKTDVGSPLAMRIIITTAYFVLVTFVVKLALLPLSILLSVKYCKIWLSWLQHYSFLETMSFIYDWNVLRSLNITQISVTFILNLYSSSKKEQSLRKCINISWHIIYTIQNIFNIFSAHIKTYFQFNTFFVALLSR